MTESFRIGRIAGVPVGLNWSLLVIFWLIIWSLAAHELPDAHPGYADASYWVAAVVTATLFYGFLLAHELGHALMARAKGMRVEGITLWLFGGVAKLGGEADSPDVELRVGAVGPLVSLAAAAVCGVVALVLDAFAAPALVVAVPAWLARINFILALFNLAPAYPLDGGRVLRALLWRRHGDRLRATATAARAGRTFAYALIGVGLVDFAAGASAGGLWFVFLGWFLLSAARVEEATVQTRALLGGLRVRDVMSPDPVVAPATMSVADLLDRYALHHRFSAFPLVDDADALVGLLTLGRVKAVPPSRRPHIMAGSVAWPLSQVPIAHPDDEVIDLLQRMAEFPDGRALVLEHGRLVGIVSPTDIARIIELASLRGPGARPQRPDPAVPAGPASGTGWR